MLKKSHLGASNPLIAPFVLVAVAVVGMAVVGVAVAAEDRSRPVGTVTTQAELCVPVANILITSSGQVMTADMLVMPDMVASPDPYMVSEQVASDEVDVIVAGAQPTV